MIWEIGFFIKTINLPVTRMACTSRRRSLDKLKDTMQSRWPEMKGKIREHWAKITEDDLKHLNGKTGDLITMLRKRYGYGKVQAQIEIDNWLNEQEAEH
jgi:uncharacterized protein YjbJ (UPF0337 family)